MQKTKNSIFLRKLTLSAVLLGMGIVSKLFFTIYIPILSAAGLKLDISSIFTGLVAIMFGPWFGGAVFATADILGYILKPTGAFLPLLTLTQFLTGVFIGIISDRLSKKSEGSKTVKSLKATAVVLFAILLLIGICCHISLISDGITDGFIPNAERIAEKEVIESMEKSPISAAVCSLAQYKTDGYKETLAGYIAFATVGLEAISIIGLTLMAFGEIVKKSKGYYTKILFSFAIPRLIITTVNTEILKQAYASWADRSFIIIWIPRLAEEIISGIILAYIITVLYGVYKDKIEKNLIFQ